MSDLWVNDSDGKFYTFLPDNAVTEGLPSHGKPGNPSPEALAFVREHRDLCRQEFEARLLVGDIGEALGTPPGCRFSDYLAKIPSDHVFNRYVDGEHALLNSLPKHPGPTWDLRDPEYLNARLNVARQLVALAEELLPGMIARPSPERWPLLRNMLPTSYRQRMSSSIQVFMHDADTGQVTAACTCLHVEGVHAPGCAMSILPEGTSASL